MFKGIIDGNSQVKCRKNELLPTFRRFFFTFKLNKSQKLRYSVYFRSVFGKYSIEKHFFRKLFKIRNQSVQNYIYFQKMNKILQWNFQ